jgi:DNA primase
LSGTPSQPSNFLALIETVRPRIKLAVNPQLNDWVYVIVTEGIFDALSINGLALMHNDISETQARLIRSLGREVVIVPDQDRAGLELIKKAEEFGFAVSIPEWDLKVKDINDAVIKYGQLPTLLSIIENKERNSVKIKLKTQWLKNKIKHGLSRT